MIAHRSRAPAILGAVLLLLAGSAPPAAAHKTQAVGAYRVTVGWADEPAYAGSRNAVVVIVTDAAGTPLADPVTSLMVEVSFGAERIALPLLASSVRRGEFSAALVPTRAGTYAFHISGQVKAQALDLRLTCSDTTFDCVADAADIQFPAKDPSPGELAARLNRSLPRSEAAAATAARAQTMAIAAIALAALALLSAVALGLRRSAGRP